MSKDSQMAQQQIAEASKAGAMIKPGTIDQSSVNQAAASAAPTLESHKSNRQSKTASKYPGAS
jgi:hypothetical protein